MTKVPVSSLRLGQRFTEPVYLEGDNIFVSAGLPIRQKEIDRIKSWGIEYVYTNGKLIGETPSAAAVSSVKAIDPSRGTILSAPPKALARVLSPLAVQENSGVYRSYLELIQRLDGIFRQIADGTLVESRVIDTIASRLLQTVRESRAQVIGFILGSDVSNHSLAKNSINVAILSALLAWELKMPNHKVMYVITGALLHDVGMLKLPKDIIQKQGQLSDVEAQRMRTHPLYTYKIVCRELLYPEDVGLIALQHHERWDGEGYPRRLFGGAIDLGARIVSVADAFEAMVSEKPYRNSLVGYQAMKNLLSDNSRRFDPDVLKAFIRTMGIYPIGSIVLLNNGAVARVYEIHPEAQIRPKIQVLIDENGKTLNANETLMVDLMNEKSLFIARVIDPKEYASPE